MMCETIRSALREWVKTIRRKEEANEKTSVYFSYYNDGGVHVYRCGWGHRYCAGGSSIDT